LRLTIAIGFVVDDAIVVVENIIRHIEEGLSPYHAALKVARIAVHSPYHSLSLVAVFFHSVYGGILGRCSRIRFDVTAFDPSIVLVSLTSRPYAVLSFMRIPTSCPSIAYRNRIHTLLTGYRSPRYRAAPPGITLFVFFVTSAAPAS